MFVQAAKAQEKANTNLVNSRRGIDVNDEEFKQLDKIIKDGIDENRSIYQIKIENNVLLRNAFLLYMDILIKVI